MSRKPDIRLTIKRKSGGQSTGLLAAWESEKHPGIFSASLDRSIVRIEVVYADGRRESVEPATHWINAYMAKQERKNGEDDLPF